MYEREPIRVGRAEYAAILLLCSGIVALMVTLWTGLYPYTIVDDAYIHFRIAEQYINTGKPYFNTGEAVMATSSPLWTLVLSVLAALPGEMAWKVFVFVEIPVMSGVVALTFLVFRRYGVGIILATVYASGAFLLLYGVAMNLMETPFAILLLVCALLLLHERNAAWSLFGVAACFVRYELSIVFLAMATYQIAVLRNPVRPAIYAIAFGGAILVWLYTTFGVVVPNAMHVKSVIYDIPWGDFLISLFPGGKRSIVPVSVLIVAVLAYAAIKGRSRLMSEEIGLPLVMLLSGIAIFAAYVIRHTLMFQWYIPNYTTPIFIGISALSFWVAHTFLRARKMMTALSLLPLLLPAPYFIALAADLKAATVDLSQYRSLEMGGRVARYLEVGHELYSELPNGVLLTSEIGGLGYGYRGYIADGVGLATPAAVAYHLKTGPQQRKNGAIPPDYVRTIMPDFIVTYPVFAESLLRDEIINRYHCSEESHLPARLLDIKPTATVWGDQSILVCRRLDLVGSL